jgi:hypothetical protein
MEADTTFRLSVEKLTDLIAVVASGAGQEAGRGLTETVPGALNALLGGQPPLSADVVRDLSQALELPEETLQTAASTSIQDLVLDAQTEVGVLRFLKEFGKERSAWGETFAERAAGTVLYCAAIASSLVFHDERISSFADVDLAAELYKLTRKACIPGRLRCLFDQAIAVCKAADGESKPHGNSGTNAPT